VSPTEAVLIAIDEFGPTDPTGLVEHVQQNYVFTEEEIGDAIWDPLEERRLEYGWEGKFCVQADR
jgi:hypothetical protein